MKAKEFLTINIIEETPVRTEKSYIPAVVKKQLNITADFWYEEIIDPIITIRKEDVLKALEMAYREGVKQGEELTTVE
jgi:hypothetical protein